MNRWRLLRGWAVLSAAALLGVTLAMAQTQGGGGGSTGGAGGGNIPGGGGGAGGNIPSRPTEPPGGADRDRFPQQGPDSRQQFPEMRRPMFLQGKVVFEDGTPAPPSVLIERICSGRPIPEGYTDSKGRFSFELGRNANLIADASTSTFGRGPMDPGGAWGDNTGGFGGFGNQGGVGGLSERDLAGCELRANLPGYLSTAVELTGRRIFDNPDVGTIILKKLGNVEGYTISMTSLQAPKKAKKAYESGLKEAGKKKFDKAQIELEKAVAEYPEYAEAWSSLGQIYQMQNSEEKAREAYGKAIAADGKYMQPYLKLAMLDAVKSDWRQVADTTGRVLKANPYDFPDAYFLNSMAHLNLNNHSEAEKSAREAIKMKYDQKRPQIEQILGVALANQNDFEEAMVHLKRYLELAPGADNAPVVRQQVAQIEQFVGQQKRSQAPRQAVAAEQPASQP